MDSKPSAEPLPGARRPPVPVKIVIAGGFGVGKTTAVSVISEIPPLTTEAAITSVAADIDRTGEVPAKVTTTVALDFGCITIDEGLKLYLFGTPGQDRFGFMWQDLSEGALGALVVVDARRIDECYPAVDYFEKIGLPFVVAVNLFNGELIRDLADYGRLVHGSGPESDAPVVSAVPPAAAQALNMVTSLSVISTSPQEPC